LLESRRDPAGAVPARGKNIPGQWGFKRLQGREGGQRRSSGDRMAQRRVDGQVGSGRGFGGTIPEEISLAGGPIRALKGSLGAYG